MIFFTIGMVMLITAIGYNLGYLTDTKGWNRNASYFGGIVGGLLTFTGLATMFFDFI